MLFCPNSISFFFKDNSKVEKSDSISLLINCYFEIVNGSLGILFLVVEKNANVEVCFKVLWVGFQSFLVVRKAFLEVTLVRGCQVLDACSNWIETVDVLRIQIQDFKVDLFLTEYYYKNQTYSFLKLFLINH